MEIFLMTLFLALVFAVFAWFNSRGEVYTASVRAEAKRVEFGRGGGLRSSSYNYLVTFRFSDGQLQELYVPQGLYPQIAEGTTGQIVWCKETVSEFIPDMEVRI